MKTTIKDVARESGYSIATVSLALSGKPSRIAQETKEKIIEVAQRLNYTPNQVAVSLATSKSHIIGLIITDMRNAHVASSFMSIDLELQKNQYSLLCSTVSDEMQPINGGVRNMVACGIEGIIDAQPEGAEYTPDEMETIRQLKASGLPVVSYDNMHAKDFGVCVNFNYFLGGYMAVKHLIENGHRRIGCVTGQMDYRVTVERLNGYKKALSEAAIPYDPKLVYTGNYEIDSGSSALPYLLGQKVTAIFAFNDQMAFGIYRAARNYGIRIPQDLSIVGFDNVLFSDVLEVPLTSIHIPTDEMGNTIAKEMLDMLKHGKPKEPRIVTFEPNLMIRGSTARLEA